MVDIAAYEDQQRDRDDVPSAISEPVGSSASGGGDQILPDAHSSGLLSDGIREETRQQPREEQDADPVVRSVHVG